MYQTIPTLDWLGQTDKHRPLLNELKFGDKVIPWPHDCVYWFAPQRYDDLSYHRLLDIAKDRKIKSTKVKVELVSALYAVDKLLDNQTVLVEIGSNLPSDIFSNPFKRNQLYQYHLHQAREFKKTPIAEPLFYAYLAHRSSSLKNCTEIDLCQLLNDLTPANTFYYDEMLKKKGEELFSLYGDDAKMLYAQFIKGV